MKLRIFSNQIDEAACQRQLNLTAAQRMLKVIALLLGLIDGYQLVPLLDGVAGVRDNADIIPIDYFPVLRRCEGEGQNTEVDQVL